MKVQILYNNKVYQIDFEINEQIEILKQILEIETGLNQFAQQLQYKNQIIQSNKTLQSYGYVENDILTLANNFQQNNQFGMFQGFQNLMGQQQNAINQQFINQALQLKSQIIGDEQQMHYLLNQNPEFAQAILNDDINVLARLLQKQHQKKQEEQRKRLQEIAILEQDPLNPENQKKIEELIHQNSIDQHLQFAQEYMPENFVKVPMLYIDIEINGHPLQAFVDSGAQQTIISQECAQKCNLTNFIDKRYAGMAQGVGTCKILGKIHQAKLKIQNEIVQCSLTVIERSSVDFLFGLDMLKKFQCIINLKDNTLSVGEKIKVNFLKENEIKEKPQSAFSTSQQNMSQNEKIQKLQDFGFTKDQAIDALKQTNGDVEMAAGLLFN